jgi:hypothetical protein
MNEIIEDYIRQTSCKIIINKLQKVLTYVICQQMDEKPRWHFFSPQWNVHENLTWRLVAKKLHIVAYELHHIYNIIYNIGCPLQLLQFVH